MPMHDVHDEHPAHANPRSTASFGGHPIHPMLVPFPIACFTGALVADIMFISRRTRPGERIKLEDFQTSAHPARRRRALAEKI